MAAGFLDLLQRELRNTVVHHFATEAALNATIGIDGQIASAEGSLYIWDQTVPAWVRLAATTDATVVFEFPIPDGAPSPVVIPHGLAGRPVTDVVDGTGAEIGVEVVHGAGQCEVRFGSASLPNGTTITCVGSASP